MTDKKASKATKPDVEQGLEETKPLLGGVSGLLSGKNPVLMLAEKAPPIMAYDPEQLTNWRAVISLNGTIFRQPAVLLIIISQLAVAMLIAGIIVAFINKPEAYQNDSMDRVVKTIAVSIAFLLGMFLSSCISRWWDTIKSLESLFGTCKRLTMTAINLELPTEAREKLSRRSVLSARCLQVELAEEHLVLGGKITADEQLDHWGEYFRIWREEGKLSELEQEVLERVPAQQRSFFAWSLVSQELIELRAHMHDSDGTADVMAYDRLCDLVQDGVASVSNVRTAAAFQMPYIYVHMLAFMIHFVNMLTALGTGIKVGLLISTAHKNHWPVDTGGVGSALVFLCVQAFIYQAFLTIGAALSFPITGAAYRIPLLNMVDALGKQLALMNGLADDYGKGGKRYQATKA